MEVNELTKTIINAAIEVHNYLGPGLLENAYQQCLMFELNQRRLKTLSQLALPVTYKDNKIDLGYRVDFLVENLVIIELKACSEVSSLHKAQLLSYLKLSNIEFGLLINFNSKLLKNGITRIANPLRPRRSDPVVIFRSGKAGPAGKYRQT